MNEEEIKPLLVWLSWLECCPVHQKVGGFIPGQGTYLGCGFNPWSQSQPVCWLVSV